jgi:glutamate formiminotransferase/formiminotetrahydrofolate cyclodeaminase
MVANLSAHKRGWDERWEEFSDWAEQGKAVQSRLLKLVDEDTRAFNAIMTAFGLPRKTPQEQEFRKTAIEKATLRAIEVPLEVMKTACDGFEVVQAMAETGNPNSVSDAGVGALALFACVEGAWLNVRINSGDLRQHEKVLALLAEGEALSRKAEAHRKIILELVNDRLSQ